MASASSSTKPMRERVEEYILGLQDTIVTALEKIDPNAPSFKRDSWVRAQGGKGVSCVFAAPALESMAMGSPGAESTTGPTPTVLEKAGVNISIVHGKLPPAAVKQMRADHSSLPVVEGSLPFFAAGISLVIHPRNPHAPTVHANYRYFEVTAESDAEPNEQPPKVLAWWFGGGADLTPSYLYESDATHFHTTLKSACDANGTALYPAFKKWCDEYFYLPHRGETRGVGGLFFDDLCEEVHARIPEATSPSSSPDARPWTPDAIFALMRSLGDAFLPSYLPILSLRSHTPSTPAQRRWHLLRRGRYVEFNLVYDRGTKFGLNTPGARIESILMSLPETARWEYMSEVGEEEGSEEKRLMEVLKAPREWV